jgi:alpha-glucosidase
MGWEYQLIDWHWYGDPFFSTPERWDNLNPDADILTENPNINIPELVEYAKKINIRVLLWLEWEHANKQMEEAFPLYEKWGVAGVKVDFMIREDQEMVKFYHRLVKLAAKHHLVVNFHGAYKPTGISRTYPNLLTREGVMGNEYTKWSREITPEHNTTIAYTRNMLGEMDYTPGAFLNVTEENFIGKEDQPSPMVMSTRCHQLAMLIVYESALQVLCDSPFNYRNSPSGLNFLKLVPTTWDETKFLKGEIGEYISIARRSGNDWYVGNLNNSTNRKIEINLDFLDEGSYTAHIWKDGSDADIDPTSLVEETKKILPSATIEIDMAIGGGQVIIIRKDN